MTGLTSQIGKIRRGELFHISAGGDIDKNNCVAKQSKDYPYPVYANALVNNGTYGYANYYKIDGDTFTVTGRGDVGHAVARRVCTYPLSVCLFAGQTWMMTLISSLSR